MKLNEGLKFDRVRQPELQVLYSIGMSLQIHYLG